MIDGIYQELKDEFRRNNEQYGITITSQLYSSEVLKNPMDLITITIEIGTSRIDIITHIKQINYRGHRFCQKIPLQENKEFMFFIEDLIGISFFEIAEINYSDKLLANLSSML